MECAESEKYEEEETKLHNYNKLFQLDVPRTHTPRNTAVHNIS